MSCKECSPDKKPIKFYWEDGIYMTRTEGELNMPPLMVSEHLGIDIPEGIDDFEVCFACGAMLVKDITQEEQCNQLLRTIMTDIVMNNAEQMVENSEEELDKRLKGE